MINYIIKPCSPLARKIRYHHKSNGKPALMEKCRTPMFCRMKVYDSIFIDLKLALPYSVCQIKETRRRINRDFDCYFHIIKPRYSGDLLEIVRLY